MAAMSRRSLRTYPSTLDAVPDDDDLGDLLDAIPGLDAWIGQDGEALDRARRSIRAVRGAWHDRGHDGTGWDAMQHDLMGDTATSDNLDRLDAALKSIDQDEGRVLGAGLTPTLKTGQTTTAALSAGFHEWLAGPHGYRMVRNGPRGAKRLDGRMGGAQQAIAPLLALLGIERVRSSVWAETLAHLSLYIDSGWAERDFGSTHDADIPETVRDLRELRHDLLAGAVIDPDRVQRTVQARFSQLFIRARVVLDGTTPTLSPVGTHGRHGRPAETAGAGEIDVLIRDALFPNRLHMALVTASDRGLRQGEQMAMHTRAVNEAGRRGSPPLSKGSGLHRLSFFSTAYLSSARHRASLRTLEAGWRSGGMGWQPDVAIDLINLLPLFEMLASDQRTGGTNSAAVLFARHRRFGAGNSPFDPNRPLGEQQVLAVRLLSQAIEQFAAAAPLVLASGDARLLGVYNMLARAASGMVQRLAVHRPRGDADSAERERQTLDIMAHAVPAMDRIIEQIALLAPGQIDTLQRFRALVSQIDFRTSGQASVRYETVYDVDGEDIPVQHKIRGNATPDLDAEFETAVRIGNTARRFRDQRAELEQKWPVTGTATQRADLRLMHTLVSRFDANDFERFRQLTPRLRDRLARGPGIQANGVFHGDVGDLTMHLADPRERSSCLEALEAAFSPRRRQHRR